MKGLLGFLFLIIAPQLLAGPFDPPATDESVIILGNIFGGMVGDIYLSGVGNSVFYDLIEKLNFTIIAGGALILTYVGVASVIHTAHEGSFLGQEKNKWQPFWIGLRAIIGLSLMVPTPATGYSLIQVGVMWLVLQGIGVADILWGMTLDSLSGGVSATTGTITDPSLLTTGQQIAPNILNAALCMQSVLALSNANPTGDTFVYTKGNIIHSFAIEKPYTFGLDNNGIPYASVSGTVYFGIPGDNLPQPDAQSICGTVNLAASVSLSEYPQSIQDQYIGATATQSATDAQNMLGAAAQQIYSTKLTAIAAMMGVLQPLAQGYVSGQYASINSNNSALAQAPPGYIYAAGNAYAQVMGTLVIPQAGKFNPPALATANPYAGNVTDITQGANATAANITTSANTTANNLIQNYGLAGAIPAGYVAAGGAAASGSVSGAGQAAGAVVNAAGNAANYFSNTYTMVTTPITDFSDATMAAIAQGAQAGWISAGAFYFILNRSFTSTLFNDVTKPFNSTDYSTIPSCDDPNIGCLAAYTRYNLGSPDNAHYLNANIDQGADQTLVAKYLADGYTYCKQNSAIASASQINFTSPASSSTMGSILDSYTNATKIVNIVSEIFNSKSWDQDPLLAHAHFGTLIMAACEATWVGIGASSLISFIFMLVPKMSLGTVAGWSISFGLVAILMPLLAAMWAFGAMLAIYMPLIPFMFFSMGCLGWFLQIAEALIAAPIVAVGLLTPGGEALGRSQAALMILANIFLRPVMMIFGFLLACRIYKAIVQLIDSGMGAIFQTINVNTFFSVVVVIVVYVTFTLSVTNMCFALIYELPNKILRWLGGSPEPVEIGDIGEVKQAAEASGNLVGGFLQKSGLWRIQSVQKQLAKAAQNRLRGGGGGSAGTPP